jgi:hypothetical protein
MADGPRWKSEPEEHDFPAALSYLSLLLTEPEAAALVDALRVAGTTRHKAKDLLRASALPLLSRENAHVRKDLDKVEAGQRLSPVLLVRGRLGRGEPLTVADGYHRICALYHLDEDADVPCRIVERPVGAESAPPP